MKKQSKNTNFEPQLSESTKEEILEASRKFKEKFGKELSRDDAVKYASLRKELGYWLQLEKESEKEDCVSKKIAEETQELFQKKIGKEITLKQAYLEAEKLLITTIADARTRIDREIRGLINKYK